MGIKSGKGTLIPLITVIDVYIIYVMNSLPGLAIAPLLGDMNHVFPHAPDLEIQMLTTIPSLLCIPFILFGGQLASKFNNLTLLNIGCVIFFASGVLMLFVTQLWQLVLLSAIMGAGSGITLPLSTSFIAQLFTGGERTKQFGYTSAVSNIVLIGTTIGVGYIGEHNWRLPFAMYLIPIVPIILTPVLKKYVIVKPVVDKNAPKINPYKEINKPQLVKYLSYVGLIGFLIIILSIDLPFLMEQYHHKSGITGDIISLAMFMVVIPGFFLKPLVKFFGKGIYEICLLMIGVGYTIVLLSQEVWVIAVGMCIAAFFYGVANPFVYDRSSHAATSMGVTLALAWLLVVVNIASVVAPYIIDGLKSLFGFKSHTFSFYLCAIIAYITGIAVFIRRIIISHRKPKNPQPPAAAPENATAAK